MQSMKDDPDALDEVGLDDDTGIDASHGQVIHFVQQQPRGISPAKRLIMSGGLNTSGSRPQFVQVVRAGGQTLHQVQLRRPTSTMQLGVAPQQAYNAPLLAMNTNTAMQYGGQTAFLQPSMPQTLLHFPQQVLQQTKRKPSAAALPTGGGPGMFMQPVAAAGGAANLSGGAGGIRRPCNCTKSHCLKLYCDCFAAGQLCQNCNCANCMNNLNFEEERSKAIKQTLDRNPMAFHPKIGKGEGDRRHTKGCNCKRSGCLKNYCECYEAKISCTDLCRCHGCRNTEESIERRSLMRLAAVEIKNKQNLSGKKMQLSNVPQAHSYLTCEVLEATVNCLLEKAADAESEQKLPATQEHIILSEFGIVLRNIIDTARKPPSSHTHHKGGHLDGMSSPMGGPSYGSYYPSNENSGSVLSSGRIHAGHGGLVEAVHL